MANEKELKEQLDLNHRFLLLIYEQLIKTSSLFPNDVPEWKETTDNIMKKLSEKYKELCEKS